MSGFMRMGLKCKEIEHVVEEKKTEPIHENVEPKQQGGRSEQYQWAIDKGIIREGLNERGRSGSMGNSVIEREGCDDPAPSANAGHVADGDKG